MSRSTITSKHLLIKLRASPTVLIAAIFPCSFLSAKEVPQITHPPEYPQAPLRLPYYAHLIAAGWGRQLILPSSRSHLSLL